MQRIMTLLRKDSNKTLYIVTKIINKPTVNNLVGYNKSLYALTKMSINKIIIYFKVNDRNFIDFERAEAYYNNL
jgi:hypothetical protein